MAVTLGLVAVLTANSLLERLNKELLEHLRDVGSPEPVPLGGPLRGAAPLPSLEQPS